MTNQPSIDHTILSPNGRVSRRAKAAALKREHDRLFPPGFWDAPIKSETAKAAEKRERLLRSAANLRDLAARGMSPRKHIKVAEKLEAEANEH